MRRVNEIRYFDLVKQENVDEGFAKRLGYNRIFTKKEIEVKNWLDQDPKKRFVIMSNDQGTLARAIRRINVIGIIIEDSLQLRKVINDAAEYEKLIILDASRLISVDQKTRMRNLHRMRNLYKFARRYRAEISVCTLADEKHGMLSSIQLLEVAKLIGGDEKRAKEMIENLGKHYDN